MGLYIGWYGHISTGSASIRSNIVMKLHSMLQKCRAGCNRGRKLSECRGWMIVRSGLLEMLLNVTSSVSLDPEETHVPLRRSDLASMRRVGPARTHSVTLSNASMFSMTHVSSALGLTTWRCESRCDCRWPSRSVTFIGNHDTDRSALMYPPPCWQSACNLGPASLHRH